MIRLFGYGRGNGLAPRFIAYACSALNVAIASYLLQIGRSGGSYFVFIIAMYQLLYSIPESVKFIFRKCPCFLNYNSSYSVYNNYNYFLHSFDEDSDIFFIISGSIALFLLIKQHRQIIKATQ
ncbi:hypothetical protein PMAYCL1PPCAC_27289, partial [Pristionchus mayeri]